MSAREPLPPRGERAADRRARAEAIVEQLAVSYPDSHTALTWNSPFELLIATILSAQCTDERVNQVTPALFERCPTPAMLGSAPIEELEELVQPTGFFRQKAKNIKAAGARLDATYGGVVPHELPELITLPGVARKTANVVISNCFPEHAAGIAVDTHVQRIARRLGLVRTWDPVDVERELMRVIPTEHWNVITHLMIDHGRAVCKAPRPLCETCPIARLCPSRDRFLAAETARVSRRPARRRSPGTPAARAPRRPKR